jgi:hypothetical protein
MICIKVLIQDILIISALTRQCKVCQGLIQDVIETVLSLSFQDNLSVSCTKQLSNIRLYLKVNHYIINELFK